MDYGVIGAKKKQYYKIGYSQSGKNSWTKSRKDYYILGENVHPG